MHQVIKNEMEENTIFHTPLMATNNEQGAGLAHTFVTSSNTVTSCWARNGSYPVHYYNDSNETSKQRIRKACHQMHVECCVCEGDKCDTTALQIVLRECKHG